MDVEASSQMTSFPAQHNKGHEAHFEENLRLFAEYIKEHGHPLPPVKNPDGTKNEVGQWVHYMRKRYRTGDLSPTRIKQLNDLGMIWDPDQFRFDVGLLALAKYKEREGDTRVSQDHVEEINGYEFPLGRWVSTLRTQFKNGKVKLKEFIPLDELGMMWSVRTPKPEQPHLEAEREAAIHSLRPELQREFAHLLFKKSA